jgi:hypothetical protein
LWLGLAISVIPISIPLSRNQRNMQLAAAGLPFLFKPFFGRLRRRSSPLQRRDRTSSHSSTDQRSHFTIHQIFCFIVVKTIPSSFVNIGWNTCIIYAMLNATIYFFLVETKGNNVILNNITEIFFRSSCQGYVLRREVSFLTYLGTLLSS